MHDVDKITSVQVYTGHNHNCCGFIWLRNRLYINYRNETMIQFPEDWPCFLETEFNFVQCRVVGKRIWRHISILLPIPESNYIFIVTNMIIAMLRISAIHSSVKKNRASFRPFDNCVQIIGITHVSRSVIKQNHMIVVVILDKNIIMTLLSWLLSIEWRVRHWWRGRLAMRDVWIGC